MTDNALAAQCRIDTPLGPLTAAASAQGLVGLWFDGQKHHPGPLDAPTDAEHPHLRAAQRAIDAYFDPDAPPAELPSLDLRGTPFQRAVWQVLAGIPRGATLSYARVASAAGKPAAVRAVGAAVGRNPVSVLLPCHRVVGSDGALTGYAGGIDRKIALLRLEGGGATLGRDALGHAA